MQKSSAIVDLSSASCQACASSFLGGCRLWCASPLRSFPLKPLSRRPRRMKNSRFRRALQPFASPVLVRAKPHFPGAAPRQRQSHRCSRRRTLGAWRCLATHMDASLCRLFIMLARNHQKNVCARAPWLTRIGPGLSVSAQKLDSKHH